MNDLTDEEIIKRLEDNDIFTTNDPSEAIYVLRDGTMISGGFHYGSRCEDHTCIERAFDDMDRYTDHFWEKMFERTEVVMLIPECSEAYYYEPVTKEQKKVVENLGYTLLDFAE